MLEVGLFGYTISTSLLCIMVGTCWGMWLACRRKEKTGFGIAGSILLCIGNTFFGIMGAKALYFIEHIGSGATLAAKLEGLSLYGSIFLLPLFYFVIIKIFKGNARGLFDTMALCNIVQLISARFACLLTGCCGGVVFPWAVKAGALLTCWPTQAAEILCHCIILYGLVHLEKRKEYFGMLYPLHLIAYGTVRFVIEWFRTSEGTFFGMHLAHWWSIIAVIVGACIFFQMKEQQRKKSIRDVNKMRERKRK